MKAISRYLLLFYLLFIVQFLCPNGFSLTRRAKGSIERPPPTRRSSRRCAGAPHTGTERVKCWENAKGEALSNLLPGKSMTGRLRELSKSQRFWGAAATTLRVTSPTEKLPGQQTV